MLQKVWVVPHETSWRQQFEAEAKRVSAALPDIEIWLHHIGSTAIPGIVAKPIIDILMEIQDVTVLDQKNAIMEGLGYEVMGEFGLPGRRYFRKVNEAGIRTHQIHAFKRVGSEAQRHLAFRDYMIAHPDAAKAYSQLKQKLAQTHSENINAYGDGKDPFIKEHEEKALAWYTSQNQDHSGSK